MSTYKIGSPHKSFGQRRVKMNKLYTIDELVTAIYEDNLKHFDGNWEASEDCDCHIHTTIKTIIKYWGE
jgi:hypothetical protein